VEKIMSKFLYKKIRASRQLLENPYAYLDGEGNFDAVLDQPIPALGSKDFSFRDRYTEAEIEARCKALHAFLWKNKEHIWETGLPADLVEMLDPELVLALFDYNLEFHESLGQIQIGKTKVEAAGEIDKELKRVRISRQTPYIARRFTLAHELGHDLLHKDIRSHRDLALDGSKLQSNNKEREANIFAVKFLMPEKLVKRAFEERFLSVPFTINSQVLFGFSSQDSKKLRSKNLTIRQISRILASAEFFNNQHFISLAKKFQVSPEAMAIRVEELGLVKF
jgi:Zn-dependent peptidase ImmA (M78 family)